MDRIKELEREIELTKQLIELRKQLASAPVQYPPYVYVPYVQQPSVTYPWYGWPGAIGTYI